MKKQTKKLVWAMFIIIVMFGSSFAYVIISVTPETPAPQIQQPKEFVVNGQINQTLRDGYLSLGYTILAFHYYENCCQDVQFYAEALPAELNNQLIVEKIQDGTGPSISVESRLGTDARNITSASDILESLCKVMPKPPADCGLMVLNITAS
jgi:hypothetical protein